MRDRRTAAAISIGFLGFTFLLLVNAWVVDDAYITFRTIDNLVNGYGLRWNVAERVQAYTHPLWLLVLTPFYWLTREAFYTSIVVGVALSVSAVLVAARAFTGGFRADLWKVALLLLALTSCKAFVDYTTSGLENSLAYLLVAAVWAGSLRRIRLGGDATPRDLGRVAFLASLAFLTHPDMVLMFAPALVWMAARAGRGGRLFRRVGAATLPATCWVAFSLLYYGFPFPNTAYAKALSTGVPVSWRISRGIEYLATGLSWDAAAFAALALAIVLAVARRRVGAILILIGVVLHIGFVVAMGAATTHMGGRLLAVSLFVAWLVLIDNLDSRAFGTAIAAGLILFLAWSPSASIKFGTEAYGRVTRSASSIDAKYFVYQEGAALLNWQWGRSLPDHEWYHAGEALRASQERVHVGGAPGSEAIGYFGFAAGPGVFIVDRLGLSDPLLARLPSIRPATPTAWKSGHFQREIPVGYLESVTADANLVNDREVSQLYARLRIVTRGPLLSLGRFRQILWLNWHG